MPFSIRQKGCDEHLGGLYIGFRKIGPGVKERKPGDGNDGVCHAIALGSEPFELSILYVESQIYTLYHTGFALI